MAATGSPYETIPCPICGEAVLRRMTAEGTILYLIKTRKRKPRHGLYVVTGMVRCRPALIFRDEGHPLYKRHVHTDESAGTARG